MSFFKEKHRHPGLTGPAATCWINQVFSIRAAHVHTGAAHALAGCRTDLNSIRGPFLYDRGLFWLVWSFCFFLGSQFKDTMGHRPVLKAAA
eukprot:1159744-Pelagomonas_calceolata.AAC.10